MYGFLLVVFAAIVIFAWRILAVKDLALVAAKKHCQTMDVQFLDGSVILTKIRVRRGPAGRPAIFQQFQFEFSTTGERRYLGWTEYAGKSMVSMELQAHTFPSH